MSQLFEIRCFELGERRSRPIHHDKLGAAACVAAMKARVQEGGIDAMAGGWKFVETLLQLGPFFDVFVKESPP